MNHLFKVYSTEFESSVLQEPTSISATTSKLEDTKCDQVLLSFNNRNAITSYLVGISATTSLVLGVYNANFNTNKHSYSQCIIEEDSTKLNLNTFNWKPHFSTKKSLEEELAIAVTFSEELNRIPPKKSVKIRARIKKIKKGLPSII